MSQHFRPALFAGTALATPRAILGARVRSDATNPAALIAELGKAFDEFKASNDERLKGKADVVTDEKVERINSAVGDLQKAMDEMAVKLAAAQAGAGEEGRQSPEDAEYSRKFEVFFRHGDGEGDIKLAQRTGMRASMTIGSNPDGGFFAPVEWDRTVTGRLKLISAIRQDAFVQTISTPGFRKIFTDRAVGSGWVGETAARPATSTPQLMPLDYIPGELYANPYASQQLLEDSEIDIVTWLANEVETEFARQEGIASLGGDGVNKPTGILTYVTGAANAAKHPFGPIVSIASGAAGGYTTDGFVSMVYDLPAMWTPNAKFYMNRRATSLVRKLKDGQGNYIWQPSFVADQPQTIMGYPVMDTPDMPDVGAGNVAALFGDMRQTYIVIDRVGISVLRDPYTNKPFVGFYTRKRVGGGVTNPQSMRAMTIAAS